MPNTHVKRVHRKGIVTRPDRGCVRFGFNLMCVVTVPCELCARVNREPNGNREVRYSESILACAWPTRVGYGVKP